MKRLIVIASLVGLIASVLASSAIVMRNPGEYDKNRAAITVYQNQMKLKSSIAGAPIEVRGSGFRSRETIYLGISGYGEFEAVPVDARGAFSYQYPLSLSEGSYTIDALAVRQNTWSQVALVTLEVLPTPKHDARSQLQQTLTAEPADGVAMATAPSSPQPAVGPVNILSQTIPVPVDPVPPVPADRFSSPRSTAIPDLSTVHSLSVDGLTPSTSPPGRAAQAATPADANTPPNAAAAVEFEPTPTPAPASNSEASPLLSPSPTIVPPALPVAVESTPTAVIMPSDDRATAMPSPSPTIAAPNQALLFGTLLTDPANASLERQAGVRLAHLEVGWNLYEPQEGVFNEQYANQLRQRLNAFHAAGLQVVLGVGLQYPPEWAWDNYPNSRFVNQFGRMAEPLNLVFNQSLRRAAERYVRKVLGDLKPESFAAVRVGSGGSIEALYPTMHDGVQVNSYWAYDPNAQGGFDLPSTVPPSPYPGWRPGDTSYQGQAMSQRQVQEWYDWYLGALVDAIDWQLKLYRNAGFQGYLQVLMPGLGNRPDEYTGNIDRFLDGSEDPNRTMGRGAVWHKVMEGLRHHAGLMIYISSVADGSGSNDICQPGDRSVSLENTVVNSWSATRWISYNADRLGFSKGGENPGRADTSAYGLEMLKAAVQQATGCGFRMLMWAHDKDLYEASTGVTLAHYASLIGEHSP